MTFFKHLIRSISFNILYWVINIAYVLMAVATLILPGRKATSWIVHRYAKRMVQAMRFFGGIRLNVVDRYKVRGQVIIAAKHHSWFDGFSMYAQFPEGLAFVTGDHLENWPLLKPVLQKLGAIVVDNCGGHKARAALAANAEIAAQEGRNILIYPEGHLSAPGTYHKYRTGVWHMYSNFGVPVVPVATNLGVFAEQAKFWKRSGVSTLQFMDPIPPGLPKDEFMARLEKTIEDQSNILIAQALNGSPQDSILVRPDSETTIVFPKNLTQLT